MTFRRALTLPLNELGVQVLEALLAGGCLIPRGALGVDRVRDRPNVGSWMPSSGPSCLASAKADSEPASSRGLTGRRACSRITGTACLKSTRPTRPRRDPWPQAILIGAVWVVQTVRIG
jgi:hypothetical protein